MQLKKAGWSKCSLNNLTVVIVLTGVFLTLQIAGVLYLLITIATVGTGLRALQALLQDARFFESLQYSFMLAFVVTIAVVVGSLLISQLIISLRGREKWVIVIHQTPLVLPYMIAALGMYVVLANSGMVARVLYAIGLIKSSLDFPELVNDRLGIATFLGFFWKQLPFMSLVVLAMLRTTGRRYLEVARTLGSPPLRSFCFVQIPLLLPGILPAAFILFAYNISSFELPYLLGATHPTTLSVLSYRFFVDTNAFIRTQAQIIAVFSILLAALGIGLLFFLFRLVVRGLAR